MLRAVAGAFWLFLVGTALAMVGGALGNVLLPSLVKRYFPGRTGLLVGAYGTAMAVGGAVAAVSTAPIAAATGADGWRWALGVWAVLALVAALPWLAVPAASGRRPGGTHAAVRMRDLVHSRLAIALSVFFGLQAHAGLRDHRLVGPVPARHGAVRRGGRSAARDQLRWSSSRSTRWSRR